MSQHAQLPLFGNSDPAPFSPENEISLLALAQIKGVGFTTVRTIFDTYHGNLSQVWGANSEDLRILLQRARTPEQSHVISQIQTRSKMLLETAREQIQFLKMRRKTSIIFRGTDVYPESLYHLPDPPAWLFVEGNTDILYDPAIVAVIGTRDPTERGIQAAKRISLFLVGSDCIILSGLAEGVDAVGHQTAVDYGVPTIAVLGHGVDVVFPASTSGLRRQIVELGGAIVSEYLPRDTYSSERFVRRNRIQAALSGMVCVVEGRLKGGTAHTVRFARQLNREVFGARIGPPERIPQQELLEELTSKGAPVFDLEQPRDCEVLQTYLEQHLHLQARKHPQRTPRIFRNVLNEIKRLARDYDVTQDDFDWLINQIHQSTMQEANDDAH